MAGTDVTASVSSAAPAVSRAGEGDFIVGGGKQSWIVPAIIAATVLLVVWLWKGKR